jgi:hypothetical protein
VGAVIVMACAGVGQCWAMACIPKIPSTTATK